MPWAGVVTRPAWRGGPKFPPSPGGPPHPSRVILFRHRGITLPSRCARRGQWSDQRVSERRKPSLSHRDSPPARILGYLPLAQQVGCRSARRNAPSRRIADGSRSASSVSMSEAGSAPGRPARCRIFGRSLGPCAWSARAQGAVAGPAPWHGFRPRHRRPEPGGRPRTAGHQGVGRTPVRQTRRRRLPFPNCPAWRTRRTVEGRIAVPFLKNRSGPVVETTAAGKAVFASVALRAKVAPVHAADLADRDMAFVA